jgi:hypothetical protein
MTRYETALRRAMLAFKEDPGTSDLDDEQPISVFAEGYGWTYTTLGQVREAKRKARRGRSPIRAIMYVGPDA